MPADTQEQALPGPADHPDPGEAANPPASGHNRPLDARPAEGFRRVVAKGQQAAVLFARRRDYRRCEGVWVLPVRLRPGQRIELINDPEAQAQCLPHDALLHQGDIAECAVSLCTGGWPAGAKPLVLMLWPQTSSAFRATAGPALVASATAMVNAAAGAPPAGTALASLIGQAIAEAVANQGSPGGSLARGLLPVAGGPPAGRGRRPAYPDASAETGAPEATAPAPWPALKFHLAACLYPGGLFERSARPRQDILDFSSNRPGPSDQSLQRLRKLRRLDQYSTPVLLTGDQIYADATAGLFDPTLRDQPFKRAYDRLREQDWRNEALLNATPVTLMDDHEVADNWEPSLNTSRDSDLRELMFKGRYDFLQRQRQANPAPLYAASARRDLWLTDETTLPGHLLFVGDTRSERSARDPARMLSARIMGRDQRQALVGALRAQQARAPGQIKFVATSSMLLPRRLSTAQAEQAHADAVRAGRGDRPYHHAGALRSDAWCGYPGSLHQLLASLVNVANPAEGPIHNCVFLSGDEHIGCVAEATVQQITADGSTPIGDPVTLWSVHTGALYAPFPFANSVAEDFAEHETFSFEVHDRHYRCTVKTRFLTQGDGFVEVMIDADPLNPAQEKMSLIFRNGQDPTLDASWQPPMR